MLTLTLYLLLMQGNQNSEALMRLRLHQVHLDHEVEGLKDAPAALRNAQSRYHDCVAAFESGHMAPSPNPCAVEYNQAERLASKAYGRPALSPLPPKSEMMPIPLNPWTNEDPAARIKPASVNAVPDTPHVLQCANPMQFKLEGEPDSKCHVPETQKTPWGM